MIKTQSGAKSTSRLIKRCGLLLLAGLLSVASVFHVLVPQTAVAEQLSSRRVTINTSRAGATAVEYDYTFSWTTATDVEGIIFQFCTTPLGTCTLPTGMDVSNDIVTTDGDTNFPGGGSNTFAEVASNTGDCNDTGSAATVTMYCVNRTQAASAAGAAATVDLGGVINPTLSSPFTTVYVRISLYDNNTFSSSGGAGNSRVHDGTVAAGITQQLTTTGRVQERLQFCVAAIDDDDTLPTDCAAFPTTTNIDIGVIDNTSVVRSPVEPTATNGSNDDYGVAMVNTNASGGVVVGYYPENAISVSGGDTDQLRNFRVLPTDCSAITTSLTDQCFINADANGEVFAAGTERFGLQIPCIDTTQGTTTNLANVPDAYNNVDDDTTSATNCEGDAGGTPDAGNEFAWNNAGTTVTLTTSPTVVDDEIIKLRFGATASPTTPTGSYTVVTTYIATPTF